MTERDPASTGEGGTRPAADTPEPSHGVAEPTAPSTVELPTQATGANDDAVAAEHAARSRRGAGRSGRMGPKTGPITIRPARIPIAVVRRSVEDTAALRESLAEKEAEAHDLRVSIEQLRQELSAERAQLTATRRRRFPWLWILAGLVVLAVLLYGLSRCDSGGSVAVGPSSSAGGASAASAATSPSPSQSAAETTAAASSAQASTGPSAGATPAVTTTPMRWGSGTLLTPPGLPTSGPGIDAPGADITYALDADGTSVDVYERLRGADPMTSVTATLPALSALRDDFGAAKLGVDGLQVELDGAATTPVSSSATTWTATAAGSGATQAVLRYRLTGAVIKIQPSAPGRYTALLTPLTATVPLGGGQPVVVRVSGGTPRGLSCPTSSGAGLVCGTVSGQVATATLPKASQPILEYQFDR